MRRTPDPLALSVAARVMVIGASYEPEDALILSMRAAVVGGVVSNAALPVALPVGWIISDETINLGSGCDGFISMIVGLVMSVF